MERTRLSLFLWLRNILPLNRYRAGDMRDAEEERKGDKMRCVPQNSSFCFPEPTNLADDTEQRGGGEANEAHLSHRAPLAF